MAPPHHPLRARQPLSAHISLHYFRFSIKDFITTKILHFLFHRKKACKFAKVITITSNDDNKHDLSNT